MHLYAILDLGYTPEEKAAETTAALLAGGADLLQLRAKGHDTATIRRVAETLIPLCRSAGVPFILNDFPALAAELGADGVHIGQDDGSLAEPRIVLTPHIGGVTRQANARVGVEAVRGIFQVLAGQPVPTERIINLDLLDAAGAPRAYEEKKA